MRNCVNGTKPCCTAGSRYNYKCCLHSAAAHLLLKHWCWEVYGARCEKGELCPGRRSRGKQSLAGFLLPEWEHGTAPAQPPGAAAVSADRTRSCVAPTTNTAFYWLYHKGTQNVNVYRYFTCQLYPKTQICGCKWRPFFRPQVYVIHNDFRLC